MNPIEAGKEALEAIVKPLQEEKRRLTERIAEIDVTLKPLEAAIGPLGGKHRTKKKPKAARTVTQEDVREIFTKLLTGKSSATEEALLDAAKRQLKVEQGLDLKGFTNRCREVLSGDRFETDEAGRVRLVTATEEEAFERAPTAEAAVRRRDPKSVVDNFAAGARSR